MVRFASECHLVKVLCYGVVDGVWRKVYLYGLEWKLECGIVRVVCSHPCYGNLWRMLENNKMEIVWKLVFEIRLETDLELV